LAAQRIHADAATAEIAGRHGEIGDAHDGGGALAVLGDAKTVINRRIAAGGVKPRGRAQIGGRDSGEFLALLGAVALLGTEGGPVLELVPVAAFAHEFLVDETLGDDHMRHRRHDGDVCAGLQRQMIIGLDMRRAHQVDAARIDADQLGALAQTRLHAPSRKPGERRSGWRR